MHAGLRSRVDHSSSPAGPMGAFSLLATVLLASAGSQKPGPGDNEFEFVNRCNS